MRSGQDIVLIDQGTAAEEQIVQSDRHLPRELVDPSVRASDYPAFGVLESGWTLVRPLLEKVSFGRA